MSENSTRKKTVRFATDVTEPPTASESGTSTASPMPKKTTRFTDGHKVVSEASSSGLQDASPASPATLLDTNTSLAKPFDDTPFTFSNASQASTSSAPGQSTTTTLSPTDILTWSETVTASAPPGQAIPTTTTTAPRHSPTNLIYHPSAIPSPSSDSILANTSALRHSPSDISVFTHAGEKDSEGKVMEASKEPCEKCGGKIVWATKGEWLMICEKCKEPK